MNTFPRYAVLSLTLLLETFGLTRDAQAWDDEIHQLITRLAVESLPADFPGFVKSAAGTERVAFLSSEADRWRNVSDAGLRHVNGPDHYFDVEKLETYELQPETLAVFRNDFIGEIAVTRARYPERFKSSISRAGDPDHTDALPGLLPWTLAEYQAKLKSCFSYLRAYEEHGGTAEEIENARQNVLYLMGVMAHFAGDAGQPLHTTIHHHGWIGDNPNRYTTNSRIHSWIDGGYFTKIGFPALTELRGRLRPARVLAEDGAPKSGRPFRAALSFVLEQNKTVETLYQMEKRGKLSGNGEVGLIGKPFLEEQMLKSAQLLGDLWLSAWQQAPDDSVLRSRLRKRK